MSATDPDQHQQPPQGPQLVLGGRLLRERPPAPFDDGYTVEILRFTDGRARRVLYAESEAGHVIADALRPVADTLDPQPLTGELQLARRSLFERIVAVFTGR